jgi:signal transduction histidine kinase
MHMEQRNDATPHSLPPLSGEGLQRRLERAERLLACFGKAVCHELPSRLVAIQGLLRVLEAEAADQLAPEMREYLHRLSAVGQRAETLVADLAELSRVGRNVQTAEVVNLTEVSLEAAAEVNQLFPGQPIEYDIAKGSPPLTVPYAALRQVLVQLLRQAVAGAATERPLRLEIAAQRKADGVELRVADNGRGLPPERQNKVFEPFAGSAEGTDSGLGLFLVRHLVDTFGGTIEFHSEPGRGSTFTIFFRSP